ncbi:MAG: hypothetical protein RLZZ628_2049 [Bacteroidota bacterium]|jgi:hypothetical protein
MICGRIVGFRGGKVGFVRMKFEAGTVQNSYIGKGVEANMSYEDSIMKRI